MQDRTSRPEQRMRPEPVSGSAANPSVRWSADGRAAVVTTRLDAGVHRVDYTFDVDSRHLAAKLRQDALAAVRRFETDGNITEVRRIRIRFVTLYLGKVTGPPAWRYPQVHARRRAPYVEVCAGWRQTAFVLGIGGPDA